VYTEKLVVLIDCGVEVAQEPMEIEPTAPLCNRDRVGMQPKDIAANAPGELRLLNVYACVVDGCNRCYSEETGYFDYFAGRIEVSERQTLCETDACAMFLKSIAENDEEIWQCPCCSQLRRF
jgi:hypothetical protein